MVCFLDFVKSEIFIDFALLINITAAGIIIHRKIF